MSSDKAIVGNIQHCTRETDDFILVLLHVATGCEVEEV